MSQLVSILAQAASDHQKLHDLLRIELQSETQLNRMLLEGGFVILFLFVLVETGILLFSHSRMDRRIKALEKDR